MQQWKRKLQRKQDEKTAYELFMQGTPLEIVQDKVNSSQLKTVDFIVIERKVREDLQRKGQMQNGPSTDDDDSRM